MNQFLSIIIFHTVIKMKEDRHMYNKILFLIMIFLALMFFIFQVIYHR